MNALDVTVLEHSQIVDLLKVQHSGINIVALRSAANRRHVISAQSSVNGRDRSCPAPPANSKPGPSCLSASRGTVLPVDSKASPSYPSTSAVDCKAVDGQAGAKVSRESAGDERANKSATLLPLVQRMSHIRDCAIEQSKTRNCVSSTKPASSSMSTLPSLHASRDCHVTRKTESSINSVTAITPTAEVTGKHLLKTLCSFSEMKAAMESHPIEVGDRLISSVFVSTVFSTKVMLKILCFN